MGILCVLPHATTSNTIQQQEEDHEAVMISVEAVGFLHHESFKWCATAASDGILKIWDLSLLDNSTNPQCRVECNHTIPTTSNNNTDTVIITRMKWHKTLPIIFTCTNVGNVYVWDARSGNLLKMYSTRYNICINDMDIWFDNVNENRITLVIGSDDCIVRIFCIDLNMF